MLLNFLSDLHLEFGPMPDKLPGGDVLILSGDISSDCKTSFIERASESYEHVIYVFGNHEYYGGEMDQVEFTVRKSLEHCDNVHVLQNESVTLNGVTFHGTTLWTDMNKENPLTLHAVEQSMNDYYEILYREFRFTALDALREHKIARKFLENSVKEDDVVITHMAPSYLSIHPKYQHDMHLNGGYASDLSGLMLDANPQLWFHGHVHNSFDYTIGETRILCNPRGYKNEVNPEFDVNSVVFVESSKKVAENG